HITLDQAFRHCAPTLSQAIQRPFQLAPERAILRQCVQSEGLYRTPMARLGFRTVINCFVNGFVPVVSSNVNILLNRFTPETQSSSHEHMVCSVSVRPVSSRVRTCPVRASTQDQIASPQSQRGITAAGSGVSSSSHSASRS